MTTYRSELEAALEAMREAFDYPVRLYEYDEDAETRMRTAIARTEDALRQPSDSPRIAAIDRYKSGTENDPIADPIEALRFFCSFAMNGQDWIDAEPFFDALRRPEQEPVGEVCEDAQRASIFEEAYKIAYQATYQDHNGHWDHTMRGGAGCKECIKAREAREKCDALMKTLVGG